MTKNLVIWFQDIDKDASGFVGNKAVHLGEMIQEGFPIPNGFVITTNAYFQFLRENALEEKIQHLIEATDFTNLNSLNKTATLIKKYIMQGNFSEKLIHAVFRAYTKLGGVLEMPMVLISISATLPMEKEETFPFVHGEANLLLKIKEAWASLFDVQAIVFRHEKHRHQSNNGSALLVQCMIVAEQSGTLWSIDPITQNKKKIVIEARYGAEQTAVITDWYAVDKSELKILEKKILEQKSMLEASSIRKKEINVLAKKRKLQKITDAQIVTLATIAKKLENKYYFPQEITWAIEQDKLWIIQVKLLTQRIAEKPQSSSPIRQIAKLMPTATKNFLHEQTLSLIPTQATKQIDGVILDGNDILSDIKIHPKKIIADKKTKVFVADIAEKLSAICQPFSPRPVIYQVSNFTTDEYRMLLGGKLYEPIEPHPTLGYRGAFRNIHSPELLTLELEAIKIVRNKMGCKNLWIMFPFVRTVAELIALKKILASAGLHRTPTCKVWLLIDIPSNIILLNDYIQAGVDGICIGVDNVSTLFLGADKKNPELASAYMQEDPTLLWAYEQIIKTAHTNNLPTSFWTKATDISPNLLEKLIQWGITSVSSASDTVDTTRYLISEFEKKLIS